MSIALFMPRPLPRERTQSRVLLGVVALHVALLWLANLYWPLQTMLQGAAQSLSVQMVQKDLLTAPTAQPNTGSPNTDSLAANTSPQAISSLGRQRFGRAEATLQLPEPQAEASTPLTGTVQTALATPILSLATTTAPAPAPSPLAEPTPSALPLPVPNPVPVAVPARAAQASPPDAAAVQPPAAAPAQASAPTPETTAAPAAVPAGAGADAGAALGATPSAAAGAGLAAPASGTPEPALPVLVAPSAGAPLNLNLPPRYIYRPPISVPKRSLSEMANDQLRRKPRDAFAEGIESAGNIDCLKDTPEGPAQGLLAIGPLLARAIEEKCRK